MEERILRLCKRLNRCTLNELLSITEDINETALELLLTFLVADGKLIKKGDTYIYNKDVKKPLPQLLQMHNKETVDLIIKCYCSKIPSTTACNIVSLSDDIIRNFYTLFRNDIYCKQLKELEQCFSRDPQHARHSLFFEQEVYFYFYSNNVYISEKNIDSPNNRFLTKDEVKEYKKVYCYISRALYHNKNASNLCSKIAEAIWRRNKTFDEMYFELKKMLFS